MLELNVCIGSSCHLKGSYDVLQVFQKMIEERGLQEKVEMKGRFCMGKCQEGVSVSLDNKYYSVLPETAYEFFMGAIVMRIQRERVLS